MRKELLALAVVAIVAGAFIYQNQPSTSAFDQWKAEYGVNWSAEEELYRRMIFEKNVATIEQHNADLTQTYKMGINQFTPFTKQEFIETYLTTMIIPSDAVVAEEVESHIVGADIDWVSKGMVSPIKNQGQCGSCWAFTTAAQYESLFLKYTKTEYDLSEQHVLQCTLQSNCDGGFPNDALKTFTRTGLPLEKDYPYKANHTFYKEF